MLVENGVLSNAQAIDVVATACEVKAEVAEAIGESAVQMRRSLTLLGQITDSFRVNDPA